MTIIRVKKDARYFAASNEPFNDKRLSWEARGLMGYLLSKKNNWVVRMEDLEKQGPAGNFKLRRMLAELRQYGYVNRIRVTNDDKTFEWITEVYESPSQNPNPSKGIIKASGGKTTSGSSTSGKPPDIVNTDASNTEPPSGEGEPPVAKPQPLKANQIPEVVLFREVTKRYPNSANFEDVVQSVQKVRERLGREVTRDDLLHFYKSWTSKGYNPLAITWLQWAETGQIPVNGNWKPRENNIPRGVSVAQSWLAKKEAANGN